MASGIKVTPEMSREFADARESANVLFLKYSIDANGFVKSGSGNVTGSVQSDFDALRESLEEKKPALAVFRSSGQAGKWLAVFYMPDKCSVHDRMVYSSSFNSFRDGLGSQYLVPGSFNISTKAECTNANYANDSAPTDNYDLLTVEEKLKREGEASSRLLMSETKVAAIVDMPLNLTERAQAALADAKSGKTRTYVLSMVKETEHLDVVASSNQTLTQVAPTLGTDEPRFVLHLFNHQHQGETQDKWVLVYFCPELVKIKLKMMYSSSKSTVSKVLESHYGVHVEKSIETSEPSDLSDDNVLTSLYPQIEEHRPQARVRAAAGRKFTGAKFQG